MNLSDSPRFDSQPFSVAAAASSAGMQFPLSLANFISAKASQSQTLTIHLKYTSPPPVLTGPPDVDPDVLPMLVAMRAVYAAVNIGVRVGGREHLGTGLSNLDIIDVGSTRVAPDKACDGNTTGDQDAIFANRIGVGADDLVTYFISGTVPSLNGCATHPQGQPGALITDLASTWTLAHEVGHVLGLDHIPGEKDDSGTCVTPDYTRLMTGCSTSNITSTPTLSADEGTTMRASASVKNT